LGSQLAELLITVREVLQKILKGVTFGNKMRDETLKVLLFLFKVYKIVFEQAF